MLSSRNHGKAAKGDIPILSIPGICVGGLTASTGEVSRTHCAQNERGTSHIVVKKSCKPKNFMEI